MVRVRLRSGGGGGHSSDYCSSRLAPRYSTVMARSHFDGLVSG